MIVERIYYVDVEPDINTFHTYKRVHHKEILVIYLFDIYIVILR
jgi:hypothetical protein